MKNTDENTGALGTEAAETAQEIIQLKTDIPIQQLLTQYVKHKNGAIFHSTICDSKKDHCYLRSKNNKKLFKKKEIEQGLVDGTWLHVNEHELRKHLRSEEEYFEILSEKLLRRVLYCQLIVNLDDELKEDFASDKYIKGIIERSEKQFRRLLEANYDRTYRINEDTLKQLLESMEETVRKIGRFQLKDFKYMNATVDMYLENPEKFKDEVLDWDNRIEDVEKEAE